MRKDKKKHDNRIAIELKESLKGIVSEMANEPSGFILDPARDFTRKRKLDMETLINLILSMKGGSISKELYTYFGGDIETATSSAFVQQRAKIRAEAFEYLFRKFNDASSQMDTNTYDGYSLLAVDGSDINIAKNPESDTYFVKSDYNQFHLNAVYDVLTRSTLLWLFIYAETSLRFRLTGHHLMLRLLSRGTFSLSEKAGATRGNSTRE